MNKMKIIALTCVGVGVLLTFVAMLVAGFDFSRFRLGAPKEEKTLTRVGADIHSIVIDDALNGIRVIPSPDGEIHLSYFENNLETYEVKEVDGTLRLQAHSRWYLKWGINSLFREYTEVTLSVPTDYVGDLSLWTTNGSIQISDIRIDGGMDMSTTNGGFEFSRVSVSGSWKATTRNGGIIGTDLQGENISLITTNGEIRIDHTSAMQNLYLSTTNGAVKIERVYAPSVALYSTNGSITGTIVGQSEEFVISAHTVNGSSRVPAGSANGAKSLDARTTNGDIYIEFVTMSSAG